MHLLQECFRAFIFTQHHCFLKMFFWWWSEKSCYGNRCYLEHSVLTHVLRCISRKAFLPWARLAMCASSQRRHWPCPKPRQTDAQIQLPMPQVCVNLVYLRYGNQITGNTTSPGRRAACCLVVEGHYRYHLGFNAACEVFCNLYCEKC